MGALETFGWEWGSALLRWLHVTAAIAWIGGSFFFMHLDASLRKKAGDDPAVEGTSWQVHGGGFYEMKKYLLAPAALPEHLIWHKWQSYWTWMSGFALLCWVYYGQSSLFLIDPAIMPLEPWQAALIGIVALALGWLVYDFLCRSPLAANEPLLALVGFGYVVATSWVFTLVFSGRGALIHTGALMATIMTANVFFIIMPNQRKSIAALQAGQTPDPTWGKSSKIRSTHNNYITLPVLFLMLSSHYRRRPSPTAMRFPPSSPASSSPARWCAISITSGISITTARPGGRGRRPRSPSFAPSASPRPLRPACAR